MVIVSDTLLALRPLVLRPPPGGDTLSDLQFGLVVLDEGSQCCEPESLIPLVKVGVGVGVGGCGGRNRSKERHSDRNRKQVCSRRATLALGEQTKRDY